MSTVLQKWLDRGGDREEEVLMEEQTLTWKFTDSHKGPTHFLRNLQHFSNTPNDFVSWIPERDIYSTYLSICLSPYTPKHSLSSFQCCEMGSWLDRLEYSINLISESPSVFLCGWIIYILLFYCFVLFVYTCQPESNLHLSQPLIFPHSNSYSWRLSNHPSGGSQAPLYCLTVHCQSFAPWKRIKGIKGKPFK